MLDTHLWLLGVQLVKLNHSDSTTNAKKSVTTALSLVQLLRSCYLVDPHYQILIINKPHSASFTVQ